MEIYVVVTTYAGTIQDVEGFHEKADAEAFLAKIKLELGIEDGHEEESEHDAELFRLEM